jgi:inorganic triphosphatase YgiF
MGDLVRGIVGDKPLEARYETHVTRIMRMVAQGATRIEVAFDEGMIASGNRTRPICEVELELKSGNARDLYEFAAKLAGALPLRLDIVSKAERAYRLGAGTPPPPVKTRPGALPADLMLDEAIGRVLLGCCDHYIANWAALRDSEDPEAIHQMRVALRRLRSALAMFKRALPCAEFDLFRAQAKDLASALGPARDCDAMREMIVEGPLAHFGGDRKSSSSGSTSRFSALLDALAARRRDAYAQARSSLESSAPSVFVLQLSAFVARRGWRNALSGPQLSDVIEPVEDFARHALDRLHKRVLKRGKNLVALSDEARHEARIALKNLRYGAEFFAPCFDDPRGASAFLRATAQLQNLLGAHNDAASAEHFLSLPHEHDAARAAGLITGWFARGVIIADEKLAKAWKDFRKTRQFWR